MIELWRDEAKWLMFILWESIDFSRGLWYPFLQNFKVKHVETELKQQFNDERPTGMLQVTTSASIQQLINLNELSKRMLITWMSWDLRVFLFFIFYFQ